MSSREVKYNRYNDKILNSVIYHTKTSEAFPIVQEALEEFPGDGNFLSLGSLVALLENKPSFALQYQKQLRKDYQIRAEDVLFEAIAWAKKGNSLKAKKILKPYGITTIKQVVDATRFKEVQGYRFLEWANLIFPNQAKKQVHQKKERASKPTTLEDWEPKVESAAKNDKLAGFVENLQKKYELPPIQATLPFKLNLSIDDWVIPAGVDPSSPDEQQWYHLRSEYCHLNLLKGFDELLCLNHLHNVETFWYQVETVRKVLKQFRGRVLLSDEVGLGKTIEAGMILKEYLLRAVPNS